MTRSHHKNGESSAPPSLLPEYKEEYKHDKDKWGEEIDPEDPESQNKEIIVRVSGRSGHRI